MKKIYLIIILGMVPGFAFSQTFTDGLIMPKGDFCTGFMYTHDQWTKYWEGDLKREQGNVGTITTQSLMWFGNYGITPKLNVIAMAPYVWTKASQGSLMGMSGVQDLTIGAKYQLFTAEAGPGTLKAFGVANVAFPLTDYTPDFLPLAIGSASTRVNFRLNTYYRLEQGWFANASFGYTWRSNVTLDRPAHWYNDELINNTEAYVPNVFDLFVTAGYIKNGIQAELSYTNQYTAGGDNIRRQAMPEVGNQMNFNKAGLLVMYYLPKPKNFAVRGAVTYTLSGRNVGESTTYLAGLLYTFHFAKSAE